jgi:hypothetical protein
MLGETENLLDRHLDPRPVDELRQKLAGVATGASTSDGP